MTTGIALAAIVAVMTVLIRMFVHQDRNNAPRTRDVEREPELADDRHKRLVAKHYQIDGLRQKKDLTVADLMTEHITAVDHDTPLGELRARMEAQRTRHLLVHEDGLLIGIVSDRDLVEKRGGTAADVMTPDPATTSPFSPVGDAVKLLLSKRISCLPVVAGGRPCGIITTTDLLLALQCLLDVPRKPALQTETSLWDEASVELASSTV